MKIIGMKNIAEGSVIARPIYDENMQLLINKGVVLSMSNIDKLQKRGYKYIYIQEEGTENIEPEEEPVSVEVSRSVVSEIGNAFSSMRKLSGREMNALKAVSERLTLQGKFMNLMNKGAFWKNSIKLVEKLFYRNKPTISSFSLSLIGTSPLSHAMDVTVLTILLGQRFHYDLKELIGLATSCLLHDSGMQLLPDILNKPYFLLNEEELEIYKSHPRLGYKLLDALSSFTPIQTQTILQHHERQDGKGFPLAYKGNNEEPYKIRRPQRQQIFRWAEIIAVADRYVRYCSGDLSEVPKSPQEAVACLINESGEILNETVVKEIGNVINIFPRGVVVKVVNSKDPTIIGYEGVVARENQKHMDRPQLILLRTKKGKKIQPRLIDLEDDSQAKLELLFNP